MGAEQHRCPIILPSSTARHRCGAVPFRAHGRVTSATITAGYASLQGPDTDGWSQRGWAKVRASTSGKTVLRLPTWSCSFSNYTLKYVDASFYQVARGMVLPFTVGTSYVLLYARPSLRILLACSIVTLGFFVGVFLDGTSISLLGVAFGVASSMITAVHSVVIKKSLEVVKGSALHLSWYTNLLSACVLLPGLILVGELPGVMQLLFGPNQAPSGEMSTLSTFVLGSAITVRTIAGFMFSKGSHISFSSVGVGCLRLLDEHS